MRKASRSSSFLPVTLLAAVMVIPVVIVQLIPSDAPMELVFQAAVGEEVGRSTDSKVVYYSVDALQGTYPASDMVVAIDHAYTRGASPQDIQPGGTYWFQGSIMSPEVFYGQQYIFFGKLQVYVRQVKAGVLWPDQWSGLRVLYLSPLTTLAAPIQLPLLVRSDEMSTTLLAVLLVRLVLVTALVTVVAKRVRRRQEVLLPLLVYGALAILVTAPILGNLF